MTYKYEVALSFAGENRDFAEAIATALELENVKVFYDEFDPAELWGEDLSVKLREVYFTHSRYCIMILSDYYVNKMWPTLERRSAIERLIKQLDGAYILPVRLDGFSGDVPGLPNTIGYLSVESHESEKVVDSFLKKIGKNRNKLQDLSTRSSSKSYIPRLKMSFSDLEKKKFLKESFEQIVSLIGSFAAETKNEYPSFECEIENITTREVLFTLYNNGSELTSFKIWIDGGSWKDKICLFYGSHIDMSGHKATNEIISVEEHEGELVLSPIMGMSLFLSEGKEFMYPQEAAEYVWQIVCSRFPH